MKKQSNTQSRSEKLYATLLKFFPRQYQKKFSHDMLLSFRDMLAENTKAAVWMIVLEELPIRLVNEHLSAMKGGEVKMNRNILAGCVGVVSIFVLLTLFVAIREMFSLVIPNPWFHEGDGPMSPIAWFAYLLGGVIVGTMVKKFPVRTAFIASTVTWIVIAFDNLSDWQYYAGLAKHHMPFQIEGYIYYAQVFVAMVVLASIGGFLGWAMKKGIVNNVQKHTT